MKNVVKRIIAGTIAVLAIGIVIAPEAPAQAQPFPATYCCDSWGVRRCAINPSVPGSTCFCYGQGYGYACY